MRGITKNNCKIIGVIFLSLLVLQIFPDVGRSGAPEEEWRRVYGGINYDVAYQIIQTKDGGYALTGFTASIGIGSNDFWLLKTDQNGDMEWNEVYGSERDDRSLSLIQTEDGYILAGYTIYPDNGDYDILLIKTNLSGSLEWDKVYGGDGDDIATALIQTSDGGYVIAGYSNSLGVGDFDFILMKMDAGGNLEWSKNYGGKSDEKAWSLTQTIDGGFALAGETMSYGGGSYDCWLVKTDKNGAMEWNKTYGGKDEDSIQSMTQTQDGGFALAGETMSYGGGSYDFWFVKTDSNGTMEWNRTYGGKDEDSARSIIQTNDSGFALGGYSKRLLSYDFYLIKTDSNGYMQWASEYYAGNKGDLFAFSMIRTQEGEYAMAGVQQWLEDYGLFMLKTNVSTLDNESNLFPIAYAGSDETIDMGEYVSFNGTGYDSDGDIVTYRWDFDGDGVYDFESNTTGQTIYVYSKEGMYKAYLEVTDNNGSHVLDMRKIIVESEGKQITSAEISRETWVGFFFLLTILASVTVVVVGRKKNIRNTIIKPRLKYLKFLKKFDTWTWYLIFSFGVIVLLKFIISFLIQTPTIYFDEQSYAAIAHDIFRGKLMLIGELPSQVPLTHPYPAGYSYFLAPMYLLGNNMGVVYHGMLLVNAILSTLLIFPVFFIMKLFVNKKLAFLTAILIALLPIVTIHSYLLMSENAFYLMFLISCFLLIKTFTYKKFDRRFIFYSIISAGSVGFLTMIKVTGIAMAAALISLFLYKLIKHRNRSSLKYGLMVLPFFLLLGYILFAGELSTIGYDISIYTQRFSLIFSDMSHLTQFVSTVVNEIGYFALMSYIIFFVFTVFLILYWKRIPTEKKEALSIFTLFGLFSIVFLIIITASYIYVMEYAIYTRYVSVGLPVIFMLGIIGGDLFKNLKNRNAGLHVGVILVLSIMLSLLLFFIEEYHIVNNLDFTWILYMRNTPLFGLVLIGIPIFSYLIIRYVSMKWTSDRKKSTKQKSFMQGPILLISVIIVSLIICFPGIDFLRSQGKTATVYGIDEPARWLMNHDPEASIVVEDRYNAFSGGGMISHDWFFMYASTHFWYPGGDITVMERRKFRRLILLDKLDAEYILSTHDLTEYYPLVKDFYLNLPVAPPRRQMQVDWHIYKVP